jgi:aryl-alcohol dehydrogenase-like predicted oxidoreductase
MQIRTLGIGGLTVSSIGLGCMGMSQSYGTRNDEESIRTVHRALDLGVTFFDTADVYGKGANERLLGRALGPRRNGIVLATKCGIVPAAGEKSIGADGSPAYIRAACDASLSRLNTDVIDLYYLHRVDPATPIEDSVGAMAQLVADGKVRFIGLSEASPASIRRGHVVHPITAVQSEYSLWFREPEASVLPACRALGIGFVPFSPIGRGFLAGTVTEIDGLPADDLRRRVPRFMGDNLERNVTLVSALGRIAARKGCTPAQLSLAWLLGKGDDIVPIPGTKRRTYIEENVAAASIRLGADEVSELDALFAPGAVSGDRYPADMARLVDKTEL